MTSDAGQRLPASAKKGSKTDGTEKGRMHGVKTMEMRRFHVWIVCDGEDAYEGVW